MDSPGDGYEVTDARVVTREFGGRPFKFWFCWVGRTIAREKYGYDITAQTGEFKNPDEYMESVYRSAWVAHLPFAPHLTFEAFAVQFAFGDFSALDEVVKEVAALQLAQQPPKKKGAGKG